MRKNLLAMLLIISTLSIFTTGCKSTKQVNDSNELKQNENLDAKETKVDIYEPILKEYKLAFDHNFYDGINISEDEDLKKQTKYINPELFLSGLDADEANLNYVLIDINKDDQPECIIANCKESNTIKYLKHSNYTIYDVYTIENNKPVRASVFNGCGYRMNFWLGENNTIVEFESGGADYITYSVNQLTNKKDELTMIDEYYTDTDFEDNEIIYYHKDSQENVEEISKDDFAQKVGNIKLEKDIKWIPIK